MASTNPEAESRPNTNPPSLLLVIVDLHPLSWHLLSSPPEPTPANATASSSKAPLSPISITEFVTVLMVFLHAHLASRWGNQVVVYGATGGRSKLLYPMRPGKAGPSRYNSNLYQPFRILDSRFESSLRGMVRENEGRMEEEGAKGLNEAPALVSALTKALCYINRAAPSMSTQSANTDASQSGPDRLETRILVINATPGSPASTSTNSSAVPSKSGGGQIRGGYVGLMNCVFAAQKAKVPIDVLTLPPPSSGTSPPIFLQQAAHLTEGIYWRWSGRGGLLQYLHAVYLPPPSLRQTPFAVPPQDAVDFRAVCFCHHDVVDVGFVCSVCLSIFCKPLPVCMMCKTKFPIKSLPNLKALAAKIQPIPIPTTIPPPSIRKGQQAIDGREAPPARTGKGKRARTGEAMLVD